MCAAACKYIHNFGIYGPKMKLIEGRNNEERKKERKKEGKKERSF